jgi:hypothetical protein
MPKMWLTPSGRERAELSQAQIRFHSKDCALIAVTLFSFARISAVLGTRQSDFYGNGAVRLLVPLLEFNQSRETA